MAPINRQALVKLIKTFAQNAIEYDDRAFGRQLATICEQAAVSLRLKFGGRSMLLAARAPKDPSAKKVAQKPSNGAAQPTTIKVLDAVERWELELALWREIAAASTPLEGVATWAVCQRIAALGYTSDHFTRPLHTARREKIAFAVESPDGERITIIDGPTPTELHISPHIEEIAREIIAEEPQDLYPRS